MGRNLNPTKALELYNGLQHKSMGNNVSICNSVLACLIRNGKFESSLKLFNQMKQNGLIADAITYSTVCHFKFILAKVFIFWCSSAP